jgi:hypothetical protein
MKKLLILLLLVLLSGCVSYYHPETALVDGVYYAEDDPSYVVYQGGYPGAYYPWSSLDYFYMGYYPYPGYAIHGGYSFGLGYGFASPYYPYGYYGPAPRFVSYYNYPYYYGGRPYGGFCSHYSGCRHGDNGRRRGNGFKRYAENRDDKSHYRDGEDESADFDKDAVDESVERNNGGGYNTSAGGSRYVATTAPGTSGDRGMVIRSSKTSKTGKNKLEPGTTTSAQGLSVTSSNSQRNESKPGRRQSTRTNNGHRSTTRGNSSSSVSSRQRAYSGGSDYSSSRSLSSGRKGFRDSKTSKSISPD